MSKHLFGMILTHQSVYANNRGESEGNATTLQKVLRNGELYSTVSSESIRYALREGWQIAGRTLNRKVIDHRTLEITNKEFSDWPKYLDDDVMGFMHAKKETVSRRGPLEITRAISLTPWRGEIMHNFASPGSNPSVSGDDPIPYAVEVHDTRYQYGFAITPGFFGKGKLDDKSELNGEQKKERLRFVLEGLVNLRRVGGNHARYLSDYSPEVIVLRWTDDPAPRFLYCFKESEQGDISLEPLLKRINGGDIDAAEVIIGTAIDFSGLRRSRNVGLSGKGKSTNGGTENSAPDESLEAAQVKIEPGVKKAVETLLEQIQPSSL